ncbi:MAG: hypothetical protein OJJ21_15210 [Ferrovibrio sp.]|uniref:PseG/SpsG family protein n=1 Tax=Ferrovibrio sp. TaxID=1917215 RepID=UPI00260D4DB9|nr:glycosyltransferase [Ferrovibrio sp.]MCW0234948.1 hypothetical protein [Ferrovibrio sp.]
MAPVSVILRCDAGEQAGYGHLSRCVILAGALAAAGANPKILINGGGDAALDFATRNGIVATQAPFLFGTAADTEHLLSVLQVSRSPVIVVLDSRNLNAGHTEAITSVAPTVVLDDEALRDLPCSLLINPNFWVRVTDYPHAAAARRILSGAAYNLINPEYFTQRSLPRSSPPSRILITMGGEDPWNCTSWLIRNAADILNNWTVDVVVGPFHPDRTDVERAAELLTRKHLTVAPAGLTSLIASADLALTAGGTTCYELAASGVPMAAVILEPHQGKFVDRLVDHGAAMVLASFADKSTDDMRTRLKSLLADTAVSQDLIAAGRKLFEGPGASRVAAAILTLEL